jgi:GNAT superfamily N-acetyltransferase
MVSRGAIPAFPGAAIDARRARRYNGRVPSRFSTQEIAVNRLSHTGRWPYSAGDLGLRIKQVTSRLDGRTFLTFPWRIYRSDPLWVPPLLPDRSAAIDPRRGQFFQRGDAEFFIAWRGREPVGTICCAEDREDNHARSWRDGMIGFFECIDDDAVATLLFDHAAGWARARGLDTLYGPFNLDREDAYGVLLEGRDRPPALLCGHTPAYYQRFFEAYGFEPARGDNLAFAFDIDPAAPQLQRLARLAERVRSRTRYRVRGADLAQWDAEISRVHILMNRSLAHLPDFTPWDRATLSALLAPFRRIADPELVLFAETVDGETVGWLPGIPNLNEALIGVNGLRHPWNYAQLLLRMRQRPESLAVKSVLVPPEYWDTGVAVLLFDELARRAAAKGYRWADLSLTSADNPRTPILAEHMGARIYKRYRVYRKWLTRPSEKE